MPYYLQKAYIKLQRIWYKLVTLKSSPRKIALGFAVGACIAYTPTFGIQTILVLASAALLRVNPVSAMIGVYISNPITVVPMYMFCHRVGTWILGIEPVLENADFSRSFMNLSTMGLKWVGVTFVGSVPVAIITAPIAYGVALWAVVRFRRIRLNRRIERMRKRLENPPIDGRHVPDKEAGEDD
ncbi:MAG: DUF2062 domain-containing protein [Planctomycetota bacterium]